MIPVDGGAVMRALAMLVLTVSVLAAAPGAAQEAGGGAYQVQVLPDGVQHYFGAEEGRRGLHVQVKFRVLRQGDGSMATDVRTDEIVVREDGREVQRLKIDAPGVRKLTTVLALDISGSMAGHHKLEEAKKAAFSFLDRLDDRADVGLILFDHELRVVEEPARDPARQAEHRAKLRRLIEAARPGGGTAYLDAAARAVQMLRGVDGRKAVLLMTDGVDMNSRHTPAEVIAEARAAEVPVYTLGVGEPGKNEEVYTVLVLDQSGSMAEKANDTDQESKIEALRRAASRFVELMRPSARTTLLPFSDTVGTPEPFSRDKAALKERIGRLKAQGGTLLYDATYAGIETLVAARPGGKQAGRPDHVIVLTDGKDEAPGSRRSDQAVIDRAREAGVRLHMLGLGRPREINEPVMKRMARETGGTYHHASDQRKLFDIFEQLSIELHDDGIDVAALQDLARRTGGEYYHARDVSQLRFIYEKVAQELQSAWTARFLSGRSSHDGTARGIDISVVRRGVQVSDVASADYNVHGVVVPEMDHRVYLAFLALLGGLLLIPAGLRHLHRVSAGEHEAGG
jgi:VWFA-related protein